MSASRGFTFMELIITIGIMMAMFVALINFFVSSNSTFVYQKTFIDTASGASASMNAISQAVRPADQILVSHDFSTGTYQSATSTLVLELPSVNSSGSIVPGKYDYIVFYTTGTNMYRRIEADAASTRRTGTKLLTSTIHSLTFTYSDTPVSTAKTIGVDIETQATAHSSVLGHHVSEQLRLRNAL
jgi:hypothetical protein